MERRIDIIMEKMEAELRKNRNLS
jgi:hypothetical protein